MSLPTPPKMPRQFLCTKCGSRTCEGSIDVPYPPCSNCGYLGFASDVGHTDDAVQAYGQACRAAGLEDAADICGKEGHLWLGAPAHAFLELAEQIRSLK